MGVHVANRTHPHLDLHIVRVLQVWVRQAVSIESTICVLTYILMLNDYRITYFFYREIIAWSYTHPYDPPEGTCVRVGLLLVKYYEFLFYY